MGMKWGDIAKLRGFYQYTLSPLEQKAFAGFISAGVPRTFSRVVNKLWAVSVPLACYLVMDYIELKKDEMARKSYHKK